MNQPQPSAQQTVTQPETADWSDVCASDDVPRGMGVAALIAGQQIAIIRTRHDQFFALSNFDPFSNAFVIARGIVGDRAGVPKTSSPVYKQSFSLETGECLDDPSVRLQTYPIRQVDGRIQLLVKGAATERTAAE